MPLTKQYLRRAVAMTTGDYVELQASENGAADGSTIILASLNQRQDRADVGKWAIVHFNDGTVRYAQVVDSAGPPAAGNPANYTLTVVPALGAQVTGPGMTAPGTLNTSVVPDGGSLTLGTTYYIKVSAVSAAAVESVAVEGTARVATGLTPAIRIGWAAVAGAQQYRVYMSSDANPKFVASINSTQHGAGGVVINGQNSTAGGGTNPAQTVDVQVAGTGAVSAISNGLTVELMAYHPAHYTAAINIASQNIFPWLYETIYDASIIDLEPSTYRYDLPSGTRTLHISAYTLATPSVVTTTTEHHLEVGDSVTISGAEDAAMNGTFVVASVPTTKTFTATSANSTTGGSDGDISTAGNTIDGDDITRIMMTGAAGSAFEGVPTYEMADWVIKPVGLSNVQQIVLNTMGAPFVMTPVTGCALVLQGWKRLTRVTVETQSFRIQADTSATVCPQLDQGSERDVLFQEWVKAYLFQVLMSAPSTPDRAAYATAFQTQHAYAMQQAKQRMMPRPERRRTQ